MYKLLIVEDEPLIRTGLKKYFDWDSFQITTIVEAENGKQGIDVCLAEQPDLIITDIQMPEMNGLEMIKQIREDKLSPQVIILTGFNEFEYAQKAIQYGGVSDFLLKPLQYEQSYQSISKCISLLNQQQDIPYHSSDDETLFQHIETYIVENITRDTSLQHIAEHFFYNPSYLSRLFKEKLKMNFTQFVRNIKVQMAKENLKNSQLNINDVCTLSGFSSYKQFLQSFRSVTEMTPTDYRRNLRIYE